MKTILMALLVTLLAAGEVRAELADLRLEVDTENNTLSVYDGEEFVESYTVSVGTDSHPTPKGEFQIRRMIWNPRWVPPPDAAWARGETAKEPGDPDNPMKKVKIFFRDPDYYIHGTGSISSLGSAASHGCIRMHPDEAGELAQMIMKATEAPQDESWIRRILRLGRERSIRLPESVPLIVR